MEPSEGRLDYVIVTQEKNSTLGSLILRYWIDGILFRKRCNGQTDACLARNGNQFQAEQIQADWKIGNGIS